MTCSDCTTNRDDYTVTLCPLHANAEELLIALKRLIVKAEDVLAVACIMEEEHHEDEKLEIAIELANKVIAATKGAVQ